MDRPALLLPLGVVLLVVSAAYGLGAIASHRWGDVVANERWCGTRAQGDVLCAERIGVRVDGPFGNGSRTPGNEWHIAADAQLGNGAPMKVDIVDDLPLKVRRERVVAIVKPDDHDVIALAVGDTVLPVNGIRAGGVLNRVGNALLGLSVGTWLVLVALQKRRDSGWIGRGNSVATYGAVWLMVPALLGVVLYTVARFLY